MDQAYNNVVDFDTAWAKRMALRFVQVYVEKGRTAAAKFSTDNIPVAKRRTVKVFIQEEFDRRGIKL